MIVRGGERGDAAETSEGESVGLVSLFVEMSDGLAPDFRGTAEARDEDDGLAGAGDIDGEGSWCAEGGRGCEDDGCEQLDGCFSHEMRIERVGRGVGEFVRSGGMG